MRFCAVCESLGLRRALQVAHADSLLMSMCAVPDRETQELMTMFYKGVAKGLLTVVRDPTGAFGSDATPTMCP